MPTLQALDCRTGDAPALNSQALVDHWRLFGTDEGTAEWGDLDPITRPAP